MTEIHKPINSHRAKDKSVMSNHKTQTTEGGHPPKECNMPERVILSASSLLQLANPLLDQHHRFLIDDAGRDVRHPAESGFLHAVQNH